jgi:hypothetical protein
VLWFQRNIPVPLPSLSVVRVHRFQSAVPSGVGVLMAKAWEMAHGAVE